MTKFKMGMAALGLLLGGMVVAAGVIHNTDDYSKLRAENVQDVTNKVLDGYRLDVYKAAGDPGKQAEALNEAMLSLQLLQIKQNEEIIRLLKK